MSPATIAALLALAASLLARRRVARGAVRQLGAAKTRLELDDWVLALVMHAGLVGVSATALAGLGWFGPLTLASALAVLALICWPWKRSGERVGQQRQPISLGHTLVLLAIVAAGVGLRQPTIPAALAGRDQGTYVLRAQLAVRTGTLGWDDPLLAAAGRELEEGHPSAGALDILGLYPRSDDSWRRDRYDGAYRPGTYLGDREAGEVIPQFFHLHPMLMAAAGAAFGVERVYFAVTWVSGLWLLCLACCARRLWPRGPWAALVVAIVAGSPLAIWTGRTPLSENPMALFEWAAVLAALRMRDGPELESSGAWIIAACLGFCAGVRGNALFVLPVVLALSWLRPRGGGSSSSRAAYLVLAALIASVTVHAATSYPYMHDELLRQIPGVGLGPASLVAITILAGLGWLVIDFEMKGVNRDGLLAAVLAQIPKLLALGCFVAVIMWWSLRNDASTPRPYSRLDAAPILLGAPLLLSAGVGVIVVARRWRPRPDQVWLVALAAVVPVTALLYARRQLPMLAFFYYGRYLVPELLPVAALAATAALEASVRWLAGPSAALDESRARRRLASGLGIAAALALLWSVVGPSLRYPQLRLREHAAAGDAVEWLAARLPEGAVVIAGGEGWHNGHTHNQIGGALAMTHGVEVLPYRTREDAWISAWELLVAGPKRRGEAPPPVFLLVNEAAHQHTREDGTRVALLDEQQWAPFVVEEAALLELFVHALTPVPDQMPTRVARHELRMGLLRLRVEPSAFEHIERIELDASSDPGPGAGVTLTKIRGGLHDDGRACVSPDRWLKIEIPRSAWSTHVVVITGATSVGMARKIPRWSLIIDGVPTPVEPSPGLRPHPRATLGPVPIPLSEGPTGAKLEAKTLSIEVRGVKLGDDALASGDCPYGRVAELLVLPRERSGVFELGPEQVELTTITPPETLGHAIEPTTWVAGRSLSRYRPGTTPRPELAGLAMVLPAGGSLSFAPVDLPLGELGRPRPLDVLVTLAGTWTEGDSELHLYAGDRRIGTLHPPTMREGSWIGDPIVWRPRRDRAQLRVELVSPSGGSVELRDIALFGRHAGLGPAQDAPNETGGAP